MTLMVDGIKDNLIPYISNIDSAQEMYEAYPNYSHQEHWSNSKS
jgi:hypothetical protein